MERVNSGGTACTVPRFGVGKYGACQSSLYSRSRTKQSKRGCYCTGNGFIVRAFGPSPYEPLERAIQVRTSDDASYITPSVWYRV